MSEPESQRRVVIVGGGIAGLAAAAALVDEDVEVEVYEARRQLGGRAASFLDPQTNESIDYCQHVSMSCCVHFADFVSRVGLPDAFEVVRTLHFVGPSGENAKIAASRIFPAPLHLALSLWRISYLDVRDKVSIARCLFRLMRCRVASVDESTPFGAWLRSQGATDRAIQRFWDVVLASALSARAEEAAFVHARNVFVRGFLATRRGYKVWIPKASLSELIDGEVRAYLVDRGVSVHTSTPVRKVLAGTDGAEGIEIVGGRHVAADGVIVAVPWHQSGRLLPGEIDGAAATGFGAMRCSAIAGIHLWFDRAITDQRHAVLVDRFSQWLFRRDLETPGEHAEGHYYQVVISAAEELIAMSKEEIVDRVVRDLAEVFPDAQVAKLLRSRVVLDRDAVFLPEPGVESVRPRQETGVRGVAVAGDWTNTGWPGTMESAVRSGYLAAEAILREFGRERTFVLPEARLGWLARLLIREV